MLLVTHYSSQPPEKDRWVVVPFISRYAGKADGPFFYGFESSRPYSREHIAGLVAAGKLKELPRPFPLPDEQDLWMTPDGDVYIASAKDPIGDSQRFLVQDGPKRIYEGPETKRHELSMPVRRAILERDTQPELIYSDEEYVGGSESRYSILTQSIIANLCRSLGVAESSREAKGAITPENLSTYLLENSYDFCCDPYFKTGPRSRHVDIIQFGWVKSIACIANSASKAYRHDFLKNPNLTTGERIVNTLDTSGEEILIGTIGETVAALEAHRAVLQAKRRSYGGKRILTRFKSALELRGWLEVDPLRRIVICDHCVKNQMWRISKDELNDYLKRHSDELKSPTAKDAQFTSEDREMKCEAPIPVGFIYPPEDKDWQAEITKAFGSALVSKTEWKDAPWEGKPDEDVSSELRDAGIEPFSLENLAQRLGVVEGYVELLKSQCQEAMRNDADAVANQLREKIKQYSVT
ncbi:MAG: hypothetical protein KF791_16065 [Verrucomicrobiae bacterium]|nr:hypothetical protein [Verrucomicrobiae bacterium]